MFTMKPDQPLAEERLREIRTSYNSVVAQLVEDIQLSDVRTDYASAMVVLNAH
jgi:hypothetical protein